MKEIQEIQEAEVIEEKTIQKPVEVEPIAKITGTQEITNNIKEVKEYALNLKDYYSKIVVTDENLDAMKKEKVNINKIKDKIAKYRKSIVAEFKKPIDEFEKTAKETESSLKEAYDFVNNQCNAFDEEKKQLKIDEAKRYFEEKCQSKNINFVLYSQMNQNITLSKTQKSIYSEIDTFIENIEKDLNAIEKMENGQEILIDYMKLLDLPLAIESFNTKKAFEKKTEEYQTKISTGVKEEPKEVVLQAPVTEEIVEASFKVKTTMEKLKKVVNFMKEEGIVYESIK